MPLLAVPGLAFGFELPRVALILVTGCFLLVASIPGLVRRWPLSRSPLRITWIASASFASVVLLAAMRTDVFLLTTLGQGSRFVGVATLLGSLALVFSVPVSFRGPTDVDRALRILAVSIAFVAIYGVVQVVGFDPAPWRGAMGRRAVGTFGNPNMMGAVAALAAPLAVGLVWSPSRWWRFGGAVLGAIVIAVLVGTAGNLGWVAAAGGIGGSAVVLTRTRRLTAQGWFIASLPTAAPLTGMAVVMLGTPLGIESASARFLLWRAVLPMVSTEPWFGVGTGRLFSHYTQTRPPDTVTFGDTELLADSSHAWLVDVVATTGVFGLASYLAVLVGVGLLLRQLWLDTGSSDRWRVVALAGLTVAHGVQSSLAVPTPATIWLGWLIFALIAAAAVTPGPLRSSSPLVDPAAMVAGALAAAMIAIPSWQVVVSSAELGRANRSMARGDTAGAWEAAGRAADLTPWWTETHLMLVEVARSDGHTSTARVLLTEANRTDPRDLAAVVMLGQIGALVGDDDAAERWFARAVELDPYGAGLRFEVIDWALHRGDLALAADSLDVLAVVLLPDSPGWESMLRLRTELDQARNH